VKRTLLAAFTAALVLAVPASGGDILGFTEVVSPAEAQTNATEPYVAVDRSDGPSMSPGRRAEATSPARTTAVAASPKARVN
jgi:hypothetical protein